MTPNNTQSPVSDPAATTQTLNATQTKAQHEARLQIEAGAAAASAATPALTQSPTAWAHIQAALLKGKQTTAATQETEDRRLALSLSINNPTAVAEANIPTQATQPAQRETSLQIASGAATASAATATSVIIQPPTECPDIQTALLNTEKTKVTAQEEADRLLALSLSNDDPTAVGDAGIETQRLIMDFVTAKNAVSSSPTPASAAPSVQISDDWFAVDPTTLEVERNNTEADWKTALATAHAKKQAQITSDEQTALDLARTQEKETATPAVDVSILQKEAAVTALQKKYAARATYLEALKRTLFKLEQSAGIIDKPTAEAIAAQERAQAHTELETALTLADEEEKAATLSKESPRGPGPT